MGGRRAAFAHETMRRVRDRGYEVGNVAVQLIGNVPRLGPRRDEAQDVLSTAVGGAALLSATTTDRLGFTGRGEGLAAIATALIYPRAARPSCHVTLRLYDTASRQTREFEPIEPGRASLYLCGATVGTAAHRSRAIGGRFRRPVSMAFC